MTRNQKQQSLKSSGVDLAKLWKTLRLKASLSRRQQGGVVAKKVGCHPLVSSTRVYSTTTIELVVGMLMDVERKEGYQQNRTNIVCAVTTLCGALALKIGSNQMHASAGTT